MGYTKGCTKELRVEMNRYDGKPFLKLLECYVLRAIGQLHKDQDEILVGMERKLAETYHYEGSWFQIVAHQMNFPESFPGKIMEIWERNLDIAKKRNIPVNPNDFAVAFVDQNFPDIFK